MLYSRPKYALFHNSRNATMSELQVSDLDERVRLLTGQVTIPNEILRAPVSILPLPSQWIASAPSKESSLCTIARLQIADDGLPVSLVQGVLDS
jgi:predicted glycosyltransferase